MSEVPVASTNGPLAVTKKSTAWVWYFVILVVMTLATTTTLIVYNLRQQLTPQQLAGAVALWKKHGPRSYDFEYTKRTTTNVEEKYAVQVRDGEVTSVTLNEEPLEERLYSYHSMLALFGFMDRFLEIDRQPGRPRAFVRASFDEEDGHVRRYVRSVSGTKERVEIVVTKFASVKK
jgi:hypothetical protein